jgi:hypothetical protein
MLGASGAFDVAVVVAVPVVHVVEMSADDIVGVIAVRDGFVSTAGAVLVARVVLLTRMPVRAAGGVAGVHLDAALVHVSVVRAVQVPVMGVVDVVPVPDSGMATAGAVGVAVRAMGLMFEHARPPRPVIGRSTRDGDGAAVRGPRFTDPDRVGTEQEEAKAGAR